MRRAGLGVRKFFQLVEALMSAEANLALSTAGMIMNGSIGGGGALSLSFGTGPMLDLGLFNGVKGTMCGMYGC